MITPAEVERGKSALVRDGAWANVVGALSGGIILVGLALELGAGPLAMGALAAIPFFGQLAQIPAIGLVERLRQRRRIAVLAITAGRVVVLAIAALPFLDDKATALALLIAGQIAIAVLGAVGTCSWNSWMHDFLPKEGLGRFFARRLFWGTTLALAGGLAGGLLVDHWMIGERIYGYTAAFVAAALAGFVSSYWLARVPEPPMGDRVESAGLLSMLRLPFDDPNFRRLIVFMTSWNFAVNLAAPFFAMYLLQQLGFDLGVVVGLWAASQIANALTLRQWGRLSDRLSNKSILALAAPVYLGCVLALPFSALPERHLLTLPVLAVIHALMGAGRRRGARLPVGQGVEANAHRRPTEAVGPMPQAGAVQHRMVGRPAAGQLPDHRGNGGFTGLRRADVERAGFVIADAFRQQLVPIVAAEQRPHRLCPHVDALGAQVFGRPPQFVQPAQLLVAGRAVVRLGDGDGEPVAVPRLAQQRLDARGSLRQDGDGLDVGVPVAAVAGTGNGWIAPHPVVEETLAGQVMVEPQDVGRARIRDEFLDGVGEPGVAETRPEGMVAVDPPGQQVEAEPAPLVLEGHRAGQRRRAVDAGDVLGLDQQGRRVDRADRLHGQPGRPCLVDQHAQEAGLVPGVGYQNP
ncbi:hypothetical protein [Azospirillum doebereinerae]